MKTKTSKALVAGSILLLGAIAGVAWWTHAHDRPAAGSAAVRPVRGPATGPTHAPPGSPTMVAPPVRDPLPGQGRAVALASEVAGGVASGRVINRATGDGIANAELTFTSDGNASTIRTHDDGSFELAPTAPGHFVLSAIAAPGFLPYAPELLHSTVHITLTRGQAVRGITVFLSPALDYHGRVVDVRGAPVARARVRLLGTPAGEQVIDKPETEWTTDRDGRFTFHAADDAVLEAVHGNARGWAQLDGDAEITRQLTITIGDAPAREQTIAGRVIDDHNAPVADALVRATPAGTAQGTRPGTAPSTAPGTRATAFATTGGDGTFTLGGLDREAYDLSAEAEDHAPATVSNILGGAHVTLTLDSGLPLSGQVIDESGAPAPAYTLLVFRRDGAGRALVIARSIVEARGRFAVRLARGDYELIAAATGWAPSPPTHASAGQTDVTLTLRAGATLRGVVIASDNGAPIAYARVVREANGGGASAQPANAGTVTRTDGTFELTGLPPGPFSISISAGNYHPKIEAAMTAVSGATLGPITIALTRLAEGEQPSLELVGIGVALSADGDALRVDRVIPGSGAEAAGIVAGDHVIAIDGVPVAPLGVEGTIAKIRGAAGTTVAVTLRRGDQSVQLVVQRRKLHA